MCARADHSKMKMGVQRRRVRQRLRRVARRRLRAVRRQDSHTLKGKPELKKFAGQKVQVTGTLDAKTSTIQVDSVSAAK